MAQLGIQAGHGGCRRQEARVLSLIGICLAYSSERILKSSSPQNRPGPQSGRVVLHSERAHEFGALSALPFLVSGLPSLPSGLPSDARINSTNALAARGKWRWRR